MPEQTGTEETGTEETGTEETGTEETVVLQLRFHRSLYHPEAIRGAAARFARLARFEVLEIGLPGQSGSQEIRVRITEIPAALAARMEDEFCNHALFQTIQMGRA